ncbi:MAG: phosphotransferase enzyme family protein [Devosiaceae bacterium]
MTSTDPFIPLLRKLLPSYGVAASANIDLLSVSENHTYRVDAEPSPLVFRVHRHDYHTQREILSELDWIAALCIDGMLSTAHPVPALDGARLCEVVVEGKRRWVSGFSYLDGAEPKVGDHLIQSFEVLGAINARLHQHAKAWKPPDGFVRKIWDFDLMFGSNPIWGDWRAAPLSNADKLVLEALETNLAKRLQAYGKGPSRFGLIHGDLRLANLLDDGNRLAVIDFDDCGFGWFAYDFAAAISFYEDDGSVPGLQAAWLKGYRNVTAFSLEDESILPTMIMARRLLLTAWLASRAGNDTASVFGEGFAAGTVRLAQAYLAGD